MRISYVAACQAQHVLEDSFACGLIQRTLRRGLAGTCFSFRPHSHARKGCGVEGEARSLDSYHRLNFLAYQHCLVMPPLR